MTRYVFVTGGVVSSLGKGIAAASLAAVLETRGLQGIVSYEPTELVVTVRSGTLLSTLEALLHEQNQCQYLQYD